MFEIIRIIHKHFSTEHTLFILEEAFLENIYIKTFIGYAKKNILTAILITNPFKIPRGKYVSVNYGMYKNLGLLYTIKTLNPNLKKKYIDSHRIVNGESLNHSGFTNQDPKREIEDEDDESHSEDSQDSNEYKNFIQERIFDTTKRKYVKPPTNNEFNLFDSKEDNYITNTTNDKILKTTKRSYTDGNESEYNHINSQIIPVSIEENRIDANKQASNKWNYNNGRELARRLNGKDADNGAYKFYFSENDSQESASNQANEDNTLFLS